ncbi:GATA transcription factor 4 [Hibiscus syriacus]|uniref:GATA transcription factor n=1 Tax=Hibiscus syriacus TaxID=106335 RepID=A0A6A3AQG3_HIBSY|nr:GATA transcription factor 4-like [Hibiscus syriacus]KAE8705159.1 GATA transcription factor 4 [Hibiscus syriacus]
MEVGDFVVGGFYGGAAGDDISPAKMLSAERKLSENFTVDDLLDFSNEDAVMSDGFFENVAGISTDSSTFTCNSSVSGGDNHIYAANIPHSSQFSGELCVPYDELAELEWLSNFVDDSFTTDQNLQIFATSKSITPESSSPSTRPEFLTRIPTNQIFQHDTPLPGKARSKRSRVAPCDWSTRLLQLNLKPAVQKRADDPNGNSESSGRKCLHCAVEKTPQWRTGPLGPKTLCNACGVRYKSGRLVPEYRPAASPTFVSTKHSNSHRKVLELRRQKEFQRAQHHPQLVSQTSIFGISNGGGYADDFSMHHHGSDHLRHMI